MVMAEPKTARATTTVSIPDSRIVAKAVGADPMRAITTAPRLSPSEGATNSSSRVRIEEIATMTVVSPMVAFGLARMYPAAR